MKKNKYILKINQQFNQRKSMLYFLLILLGTIFPSISGSNYFNFWYRLYHILSSPTFNAFLYLAISLNFIYYIGDAFKNYQLINRFASYLEVVKYFLEDMIIFTIYLLFIALIVSIGGAFIFCLGDYSMIMHPFYSFPLIYYIFFFIIRALIISCCLITILCFCYLLTNRLVSIIIILGNSVLFMFLPTIKVIHHFYQMPIIPQYYYLSISYQSFLLEVIVSIIEIILLVVVAKLLFLWISKKKRDLL